MELKRLAALGPHLDAVGLLEPGVPQQPYFCTPLDAESVARLGVDGIHFVRLPGDARIFCVDPAMGEIGTYVLPVAEDLCQFLAYVLYCGDANPISQIHWLSRERFRALLEEGQEDDWPGAEAYFARKSAALRDIAAAFGLEPADPYDAVKAMQRAFDPKLLRFSAAYYDTLGLEMPDDREV